MSSCTSLYRSRISLEKTGGSALVVKSYVSIGIKCRCLASRGPPDIETESRGTTGDVWRHNVNHSSHVSPGMSGVGVLTAETLHGWDGLEWDVKRIRVILELIISTYVIT